jgi:regulation of enolase protein 1 (concanavalin A-like superfamily)
MSRFPGLLCCSLLVSASLAAPVPKAKPPGESRPWFDGWDKPVNPGGGCRFDREGGKLTVTLTGKGHALDWGRVGPRFALKPSSTAPRLMRDVDGDFKVQVRVGGAVAGPAKDDDGHRAGLLVLNGAESVQKLLSGPVAGGRPQHLRIERKGREVRAWSSRDGRRWQEEYVLRRELPRKLKVGVVAEAEAAFTAVFDQLKLTPLKAKKD